MGGLDVMVNREEYLSQHWYRGISLLVSSIVYYDWIPHHGRVYQNIGRPPHVCPGILIHVIFWLNVRYKNPLGTSKELILKNRCIFVPTTLSTKVLQLVSDIKRSAELTSIWFNSFIRIIYSFFNIQTQKSLSTRTTVRIVNLTNVCPKVDLQFSYSACINSVLFLDNIHILHGIFVNNNNIIYINQYACVLFYAI